MPHRTFDEFDDFAKDYREIHKKNLAISGADSFYFAEMKVKLLQQFETDKPLKLLDIGCGDGATELFLQQYFPQWTVTGIDISAQSIEQAKQKKIPNATFAVYDGLNIPAEENAFDIVFIAGVLHHIDHSLHQQLLKEVYRILTAKGRLYLFEHNPFNPLTRHLVKTCVFDKDAKLLANKYTKKILKKANLAVTDNQFIIFYPIKGIFKKLLWTEKYLKKVPIGGQYFIRAIKG
jgi:ubiquinone/menaquinone biosynthesis C-methylase UbiE